MFDIINDSQLDIIAFCETNNCYTQVGKLIKLKSKNNFNTYKSNTNFNNSETNETNKTNKTKKLFSSIELSNLIFKPPE